MTNITARFWVAVFYTLPPLILGHLICLITGLCYFLGRLITHARARIIMKLTDVPIRAYGPDRHGGLGEIVDAGMGFFYLSCIFLFIVFASLFKEATPPSLHNIALIVVMLPATLIGLIITTKYIRDFIQDAKDKALQFIADEAQREIAALTKTSRTTTFTTSGADRLQTISLLHDRIKTIPVWPFQTSLVVKILLTLSVPVAGVLAEIISVVM